MNSKKPIKKRDRIDEQYKPQNAIAIENPTADVLLDNIGKIVQVSSGHNTYYYAELHDLLKPFVKPGVYTRAKVVTIQGELNYVYFVELKDIMAIFI